MACILMRVVRHGQAHGSAAVATGLFDSYGYGALVGVAGYHLFPGFLGNPDATFLRQAVEDARRVLTELMKIRGDSKYIAGDKPTLADFHLAPPASTSA